MILAKVFHPQNLPAEAIPLFALLVVGQACLQHQLQDVEREMKLTSVIVPIVWPFIVWPFLWPFAFSWHHYHISFSLSVYKQIIMILY